jgi:hypothetical protein
MKVNKNEITIKKVFVYNVDDYYLNDTTFKLKLYKLVMTEKNVELKLLKGNHYKLKKETKVLSSSK